MVKKELQIKYSLESGKPFTLRFQNAKGNLTADDVRPLAEALKEKGIFKPEDSTETLEEMVVVETKRTVLE